MRMQRLLIATILVAMVVTSLGCSSWGRSEKGAAIGAGTGAVVGGVIGHVAGNTAVGAALGAVVGGVAGAAIGTYMDDQAKELEALDGTTVERVGEGIHVRFDSGLLFAVNQSDLNMSSRDNLIKMSTVLQKYEDTNVLIEGHTDSDGSDEYNYDLSERRAQAVRHFLVSQGVTASRLTTYPYGETRPLVENDSQQNKALNRRVEVAIVANEELKKTAMRKAEQDGGE